MGEEIWSEYAVERTRNMFAERRFLPRNGKIFFKRTDRSKGFIYEAEIEKSLLRMRPIKESHTFVELASVEALLEAGWVVE